LVINALQSFNFTIIQFPNTLSHFVPLNIILMQNKNVVIKNLILTCILFSFLLLYSCNQDPLKGYTTEDGLMYKHHIQNEGHKAQPGDHVAYHLYFRREDSVITTSREQKIPISLKIPEEMQDNMLIQSLSKMAKGDSLTLVRERDSIKMQLPEGYQSGDYVFIDIAMLDVTTQAEASAKKQALITQHEASEEGYFYKKHTNKDGDKPKPGSGVAFDLDLRKDDLVVFTSRDNAPIKYRLPESDDDPDNLFFSDVLAQMTVGDSATILMESDSIIRQLNPQWGFQSGDLVTFGVMMREVKTKAELKAEQKALEKNADRIATNTRSIIKDYSKGDLKVESTASGLKYHIVEEGTGKTPSEGDMAAVQYSGHLIDGKQFDNSFKRGESFRFPVGQGRVIPGWDEGVQLLKVGTKAYFFIPSELGYGEQGMLPDIPANAELVFYIELEDVQSLE